jgi:hypothetical protein
MSDRGKPVRAQASARRDALRPHPRRAKESTNIRRRLCRVTAAHLNASPLSAADSVPCRFPREWCSRLASASSRRSVSFPAPATASWRRDSYKPRGKRCSGELARSRVPPSRAPTRSPRRGGVNLRGSEFSSRRPDLATAKHQPEPSHRHFPREDERRNDHHDREQKDEPYRESADP